MNPSNRRRLAVLALVPVVAFGAGCSKASDKASDKLTEKILEQNGAGDVKVDSKDGKVKIQTKDGTYSADGEGNFTVEGKDGKVMAGKGLPDGWPKDIPLPGSAEVVFGVANPDGFSVSIKSSDSVDDLFAKFKSTLKGWDMEDEMTSSASELTTHSAKFVNGNRSLSVTLTNTDGGTGGSLFLETKSQG